MLSVNWAFLLLIMVCLYLFSLTIPLPPCSKRCPFCFLVAQTPFSTLLSPYFLWRQQFPRWLSNPDNPSTKHTYSQVLHVDQHQIQPHQLHPVPAKILPPSTPALQLPESPPVAFHSLCPAAVFTAAPAQHCKAGVAPALGSVHGLSRCACQHLRPCGLQNPAGLALRSHPHQCYSLGSMVGEL